jgi:glutathione S-transferase
MIVVHHLNDSRSQRILWLLEELCVPYEIKKYQRDPKTRAAPRELKSVHPLGKSPVITDGGDAIAESGAIIDYILRRYSDGRLQPNTSEDNYNDYVYWMHAAGLVKENFKFRNQSHARDVVLSDSCRFARGLRNVGLRFPS